MILFHGKLSFRNISLDYTMIISGEKIQQLCDIYLGTEYDFNYNPLIKKDTSKHVSIDTMNECWDNPMYVFCYTHRIHLLSEKLHLFQNKFILITHNSDSNITPDISLSILNSEKIIAWYGQNICFEHTKLKFLPIGFANSMWSHGNISLLSDSYLEKITKTKKVYFNFSIHTNTQKRQPCYDSLKNKIEWLHSINPVDNLDRLSKYEFCICPEGNGVDTHRLWECFYLKVVPIVIKSEFTTILLKQGIPLHVLDTWSDLDVDKLNYDLYHFEPLNCWNKLPI
jgi:hypothetical protein